MKLAKKSRHKQIILICPECKEEYSKNLYEVKRNLKINPNRLNYCSPNCSFRGKYKNFPIYKKICIVCNSEYQSKVKKSIYCSIHCKMKKYRNTATDQGRNGISKFKKYFKNKPCEIYNWNLANCDIHHILEVNKGGINSWENLICLCPNCHRLAHKNILPKEQLFKIASDRIFDSGGVGCEPSPVE